MSRVSAAAVLFAKDAVRVSRFYADVVGMHVVVEAIDHHVLESAAFQLVVHAIPAPYASRIAIASPPVVREDTPVKLVFTVASIAEARRAAEAGGGAVKAPAAEWTFDDHRVCDGHDPEGNVFQLREPTATATATAAPLVHANAAFPASRFEDVDLRDSTFADANLRGAAFTGVALTGARFRDVDLTDAVFEDINLDGATINGVLVTDLLRGYQRSRRES